jgi:very-short-patch-repair endonuclease
MSKRTAIRASKATGLERQMELQLRAAGIACEREYRFHRTRRWRFDFAWPAQLVALEVEGGTWIRGAHSRGKHFEADCEKYNEAELLGWRVLRATTNMVRDGRALRYVTLALGLSDSEANVV